MLYQTAGVSTPELISSFPSALITIRQLCWKDNNATNRLPLLFYACGQCPSCWYGLPESSGYLLQFEVVRQWQFLRPCTLLMVCNVQIALVCLVANSFILFVIPMNSLTWHSHSWMPLPYLCIRGQPELRKLYFLVSPHSNVIVLQQSVLWGTLCFVSTEVPEKK